MKELKVSIYDKLKSEKLRRKQFKENNRPIGDFRTTYYQEDNETIIIIIIYLPKA